MEMTTNEWISYAVYTAIVVVFIIIMKMPKKEQEKKNISTSKKFNKDIKDQQNDIKDI